MELILPKPMVPILNSFRLGGGTAKLDRYGRPIDPHGRLLQGDASTWLKLVAMGAVFGRDDTLYLTQDAEDTLLAIETRQRPIQYDEPEPADK